MAGSIVEKRQQILEAARGLFAQYGFRKCTTEDIAGACGMTKAALYHYFDNKEGLFAAVIELEAEALFNQLVEATQDIDDPVEKLSLYVITRFQQIKGLVNLYQLANPGRKTLAPKVNRQLDRLYEREEGFLKAVLDDGIAKGTFRSIPTQLLPRILIAGSRGVVSDFVVGADEETVNEAVTQLLDLFCLGLVACKKKDPS